MKVNVDCIMEIKCHPSEDDRQYRVIGGPTIVRRYSPFFGRFLMTLTAALNLCSVVISMKTACGHEVRFRHEVSNRKSLGETGCYGQTCCSCAAFHPFRARKQRVKQEPSYELREYAKRRTNGKERVG